MKRLRKFAYGLFALLMSALCILGQAPVSSTAVILNWNAPISSPDPVVGYNIYRSLTQAFTFVQLNATPVTVLTYTDSTVSGEQSYDYIVESVDAAGVTSAPTNTVTVAIPTSGGSVPPAPGQPTVVYVP